MIVSLEVGPSWKTYVTWVCNFDVLLTVHLSIIFAVDQLNAQILFL